MGDIKQEIGGVDFIMPEGEKLKTEVKMGTVLKSNMAPNVNMTDKELPKNNSTE